MMHFPDRYLYLVLNDPAEQYFGNTRLQYRSNNMDYLDFINCVKGISACDDILMNKHPEW